VKSWARWVVSLKLLMPCSVQLIRMTYVGMTNPSFVLLPRNSLRLKRADSNDNNTWLARPMSPLYQSTQIYLIVRLRGA
jgi:hypothetical protein